MSATATLEPARAEPAAPAAPKVNAPHPWAGRDVLYWQITNQTTGEISARPAMLLEPTRGTQGWEVVFFRSGLVPVQGRRDVKMAEAPKAGCWTWPLPAQGIAQPATQPAGQAVPPPQNKGGQSNVRRQ